MKIGHEKDEEKERKEEKGRKYNKYNTTLSMTNLALSSAAGNRKQPSGQPQRWSMQRRF